MKKSSNVLLSAVFLTTVASFKADKVQAQQHLSNEPESSSVQNKETDTSAFYGLPRNLPRHGFFWRIFHRTPSIHLDNTATVNNGPRRDENVGRGGASSGGSRSTGGSSGGFGGTGNGYAHS